MARAITSPELSLLRSDQQYTFLSLFVHKPIAVMTGTVAAAPETNDEVSQVSYTLTGGAAASVLDGMTVLIGSAAGGHDIGIIRARSASGGVLYIGTTSDINWQAGQHITVIEDWLIWARKLAYSAGVWQMEGEVDYTDQHANCIPVPVLGPTVAVLPYNGSPVTLNPSAAGSWAPGSTISAYSWTATGASATADMATATPTITYNAPGVYLVKCTVTAATGASATGYRYVYVPGTGYQPAVNFMVAKLYGDLQSGGWQFDVTMYDTAELDGIRPQALVALYARDFYGGTEQSIGPIAGYENVIAIGWIDGATINWHPEQGAVQFTVKGPAAWMQKISAWPVSLIDTTGTPADWMSIQGLTVDKGLWHLMTWRSTTAKIIDVIPSGDTRRAFDCSGNLGSLWEQLKAFGVKIGAEPACDRYGRLHLMTDSQVTPIASRSSIPVVMDLTKSDWQDQINITRRHYKVTSLLEVAGFYYANGEWGALLARAPGNAMYNTGAMGSRYNWLFNSQEQANEIAGLLLAQQNNEYPSVDLQIAANNRMIDITPPQYITVTMSSGDNPLGLVWTGKRLIPRRVELSFDPATGMLTTGLELEGETGQVHAVPVIYPTVPTENMPALPDFDLFDWSITPINFGPPGEYIPPGIGVDPNSVCHTSTSAPENGPYDVGIYGVKTNVQTISQGINFIIRSSAHTHKTRYEIRGRFQKWNTTYLRWDDTTEDGFYSVEAATHEGDAIVGIKDVVSNPMIRSGLLVGGDVSRLAYAINIRWAAGTAVFWPDTITLARVAADGGTMTHWRKGQGTRVHVEGLTHSSGGGPAIDTQTRFMVYMTDSSGFQYQGVPYYLHVAASTAVAVRSATIRSGISGANIGPGLRYPAGDDAGDDAYFAEYTHPIGTPSGKDFTVGLITSEYFLVNNTYGMEIEVQPHPMYRIIFSGFYLYNICPPLA